MLRRRVVRNPRKELATFAITVVVIVAVFFAVLNYFLSLQHPPTSATELTVGQVRYSLEMPRTQYAEGDAIPLKMTLKNIGTEPVKLKFDHDLEFDFIVQKELNLVFASVPLEIWKLSSTRPPGQDPHERVLKPGESRSYDGKWSQVNAQGD